MEPIALTAATIATLIFSEAFKEGGRTLGKGVSDLVSQLLSAIRSKFNQEDAEELLILAEQKPEKFKPIFLSELETQMEKDEVFANQLRELMQELRKDETVNQIVLKGVKAQGSLTAGDIELKATRGRPTNQEAVVDVETGGDITIRNVRMES